VFWSKCMSWFLIKWTFMLLRNLYFIKIIVYWHVFFSYSAYFYLSIQLDVTYLGIYHRNHLWHPAYYIAYTYSATDRYRLLRSDILYEAVAVHQTLCPHGVLCILPALSAISSVWWGTCMFLFDVACSCFL
jgi:hypothetical protein